MSKISLHDLAASADHRQKKKDYEDMWEKKGSFENLKAVGGREKRKYLQTFLNPVMILLSEK